MTVDVLLSVIERDPVVSQRLEQFSVPITPERISRSTYPTVVPRVRTEPSRQGLRPAGHGHQAAWPGLNARRHVQRLLRDDTEVGHQGGVCTVTSVARAEAQCLATYVLPGGQISGQALIVLGDPAPYLVAVTGGSGKFKGVEGEIHVDPVSETQPRGGPDLPPDGLSSPATGRPGRAGETPRPFHLLRPNPQLPRAQ
jgi:hypothetical protein